METATKMWDALIDMLWLLVDGIEPLVRGALEMLLDVDIRPGGAESLAVLVVALFLLWLMLRVANLFLSADSGKPQKVVHTTDKTPAMIVSADVSKRLAALALFGIFLAFLYVSSK